MFEINDRVRISNGQILIVTGHKPQRPANPYLGVLETGHGKEYKFGPKHNPIKVGVASATHPALVSFKARVGGRQPISGFLSNDCKLTVGKLLSAIEVGDKERIAVLAELVKDMLK